jgi:hypothetical protein
METESIGQYFKNNSRSISKGFTHGSGRLSFLTPRTRIQAAAATYVRTGTLAVESVCTVPERDVDVIALSHLL